MAERPTASELVEAVRDFLERDAMGALEGRLAFHTRVAVNALGIVERELRLGPEHRRAERDRLLELLGLLGLVGEAMGSREPVPTDDQLDGLRRQLGASIRSGEFDDRFDELLAALQATAASALAIANPKYLN